jgi:UDP-N-acetylmuramoyl-tripeptide--D-alanyl-D-alanine ligase
VAVIDDSYNANPASSCASIRTAAELARASGRRLVLVLGAMFELGHESERGHDEVGRAAAASGAAEVFAVHGDARRIADHASAAGLPARFYATSAEAAPAVVAAVRPGDLLLVKGSRGVGTERVVRALVEARGAEARDAEVAS